MIKIITKEIYDFEVEFEVEYEEVTDESQHEVWGSAVTRIEKSNEIVSIKITTTELPPSVRKKAEDFFDSLKYEL